MWFRSLAVLILALPAALAAQTPVADSGSFTVIEGKDTVVVETFSRAGDQLRGLLVRRAAEGRREKYTATVLPDGTMPLLEFSVWQGSDPEAAHARQIVRVIFKEDSVAVDDANSAGMITRLFETEPGAVPYLNLSFAFLEQATRRAVDIGGDTVSISFFNLNGGQTAGATVTRMAPDSMKLRLGDVIFRLQVDSLGRLLGGVIQDQNVRVVRR